MNAKLAKIELSDGNPKTKASWTAVGLVSAFGFSALVWLGLFSAIQILL